MNMIMFGRAGLVRRSALESEGASTHALLDSLQTETDGFVFNFHQGRSGIALVRDTSTPANNINALECSQQDADVPTYTAPSIKDTVGPDGNLRYNAHNILSRSKFDAGWTATNVTDDVVDGVVTLTDDATSATHRYHRTSEPSVLTGHRNSCDIDVKAGTGRYISIRVLTGTATRAWTTFDTQTQTFDSNANIEATSYRDLGGGWYRIKAEAIGLADATDTFLIAMSDVSTAPSATWGNVYSGAGDTMLLRSPRFGEATADGAHLNTVADLRYAIPINHDPSVYDTSSSAVSIGLGTRTFTTAGSATFEPQPVINSGFDADTDWTKGANTTIAGGVLSVDSSGAGESTQTIANVKDGERCTITVDVVRTAGSVTFELGGTATAAVSASDSYTFIVAKGATDDDIKVVPDASFTGTIDNLVVDRGTINIRISDQADVDGNRMHATATSHIGTTLIVNVDHTEGSGSISSWHLIKQLGVLIESAATNVCLQSEDFTTTWTNSGCVLNGNSTVAPNGETTADTIEDDSAAANENLEQLITIADDSTSWTYSLFVKKDADTSRFPEFQCILSGGTQVLVGSQLNTSTGASQLRGSSAGAVTRVRDFGDYWRIVLTIPNNGSGNTTAKLRVFPAVTTTLGITEVTALGSIIAWGAQLENAEKETSYIHTLTATVARAADDISKLILALPWDDGGEGTLIAGIYSLEYGLTERENIVDVSHGGSSTMIDMYKIEGALSFRGFINTGYANVTLGNTIDGTEQKVAFAWATNDAQGAVDGAASLVDSAVAIPSGQTFLQFGAGRSQDEQFNGDLGYVKGLIRRITEAQLESETA